jgi:protein O-GlcNAc transferase
VGRARTRLAARYAPPVHPAILAAHDHLTAGRTAEAQETLQRALRAKPKDAALHHYLAHLLLAAGNLQRATFHYQQAADLEPANPDYLVGLGVARARQSDAAGALELYRRAAALAPGHFDALIGISSAAAALSDFPAAAEAARCATEVQPRNPAAWTNLSVALTRLGRPADSVAHLRRALDLIPGHPLLLTQLAADLNYISGAAPQEVFAAHRALGAAVAASQPSTPPLPPRDRDPDRPLRIAYLSTDFRSHSVAAFFEPILDYHDRDRLQITLYSATTRPDQTTQRLRASGAAWVEVAALNDDALAQRIRADAPDLLIDLGGHTSGSRARVMARRLAPIQATYIAYPNTTGLPNLDYRLVDSLTDPSGAESLATEKLIRIDPCFLTYKPPAPGPPLQSQTPNPKSQITLGSFNILSKLSDACLEAWAAILRRLPSATLCLKSGALGSPAVRQEWTRRFESAGIPSHRLRLLAHLPSFEGHLAAYHQIDLALDTFPYNGTTTTCEALFMGVPVVTFPGHSHAGRVGLSLLSAAGLPDLIAPDLPAYIDLAVSLAQNPARLTDLRSNLRSRLLASSLCDAAALTRRLETAYRSMWRRAISQP